ncbi:MAG: DUF937 domain-containing protein [Haliscomenobacter sp.]|nr:DUF937 domain-containing protein [Haliscomenobacter sp.]
MSNPLLSLLEQQLGNDNLMETLTQQIGGSDVGQTRNAAGGVISALMGAMAKNASNPQGANALANALDNDHDGSVLDNVIGLLSGKSEAQNSKMLNGAGIVNHLLGDRQTNVMDMVSQVSGMDKNQVGNLMIKLAPVIMGALGKTKREGGLDIGGLANLLQGTVSQQKQSNPMMNMVTSFLDKDGDGSVVDDLMQSAGKGLFQKLFGGKKR